MRRAAAMVVMGVSVMSAVAAIAQTAQTPDVIWRTDIKTSPPNHFGRHRVDFSPDGSLIGVVYQPQQARDPNSHVAGFIVLRHTADGSVVAVYDVHIARVRVAD